MRKKLHVMITLFIMMVSPVFSQEATVESDFENILMHYFEDKDPRIVDVTLAYFKQAQDLDQQLNHVMAAFYAELFKDESLEKEILEGIDTLGNYELSSFFHMVAEFDIDEFFKTAPDRAEVNDMCWAAYFAGGDEKYLDRLLETAITNLPEREDLQLFLAGGSAAWSLASNAGQYKTVKKYLEDHREMNPEVVEYILTTDPEVFFSDMQTIIAQQRAAGKPW